MINSDEIIEQLHRMSYDEVEALAKEILEESNIPYTYDYTGIIFDGLANDCVKFSADAVFQYSQPNNFIVQVDGRAEEKMSLDAYEVFDMDEDYLDAA